MDQRKRRAAVGCVTLLVVASTQLRRVVSDEKKLVRATMLNPEQPLELRGINHSSHAASQGYDSSKIQSTWGQDVESNANGRICSSECPGWLKEYMEWHREERQRLNEGNWEEYNYLLLRCVVGDAKCAGASDRLITLPVKLLLASETRRLFFIHWSRPTALEEFLVPPPGGLDWRVPTWLASKLDVEATEPLWRMSPHGLYNESDRVIRVRNILGGGDYYDERRAENEAGMWEAYHNVWKAVFIPSPPVQAAIDKNLRELELVPRQYVSAHVRSVYVTDRIKRKDEVNAIHCATQLLGNESMTAFTTSSIYFASDSFVVTRRAVQYGREHGLRIVGRAVADNNATNPLHLDRGADFLTISNDWQGRPASDFYDTFVDLYLMAMGRCITFGVGGYGKWGAAIGYHESTANCQPINHSKQKCSLDKAFEQLG